MSEGYEKIKAAYEEAERTGQPVDIGATVVCDICNQDFSESEVEGGFLFGSYAYCPFCATVHLPSIHSLREEHFIRAKAAPGEQFRHFVLRHRADNKITVKKL